MEDTFLTTDEVLAYLQVNVRTVYRLIKAGKIPAVRVGRQWRFRKRDLDAWLESQQRVARPAKPGAVATSAPPPAAQGRTAPARVLVVDDEEGICDLMSTTLALAEYRVETALDGRAALDLLRRDRVDLLITDLTMPEMDGLTLIREARRLHPDLPIIIITGYSTEARAIEAINLGVSSYLTKPFRIPHLLRVVAKALGEE